MTQASRFNRILQDGLCIGCGLCQSLLGTDKLQMARGASGDLQPQIRGELSEQDVDLVYATCPGTRCEGIPPAEIEAAPYQDLVWGPYHSLVLGWAADPEVRFEGSTGGVLTALGQFLLHSKRVNFILHVNTPKDEPTFGQPTISTTPAEVLAGAGSRYGPAAPLTGLAEALDRGEPFAVIAKPCDLNAIRNLAHKDSRVNELIRYMLTPVCGGFMPDAAMGRFLKEEGFDPQEVTALRYRGRGCPGPTTIETRGGQRRDYHYLDFWGEDESSWSLPFRCKICPDGIGEGADIAAADTWPKASPDRVASETDPGTNSMIIRTARGMELISAAVRDGFLELGEEVEIPYMDATQPHQVTKKRAVQARYDGMREAGSLAPETIGLRLEELHAMNAPEENARQKRGAYERAMAAKS